MNNNKSMQSRPGCPTGGLGLFCMSNSTSACVEKQTGLFDASNPRSLLTGGSSDQIRASRGEVGALRRVRYDAGSKSCLVPVMRERYPRHRSTMTYQKTVLTDAIEAETEGRSFLPGGGGCQDNCTLFHFQSEMEGLADY
jgi:hypothetical protein